MRKLKAQNWFVPALVGLTMGVGIGGVGIAPTIARQNSGASATGINPQESALYANLYVQTAAEYRAVCLQTYGWAQERLRQKLAVNGGAGAKNGLPPAVVLDLDETVVDNSGYQSFLDRERAVYATATWASWERETLGDTRLVPGAGEFIRAAEGMGVRVFFVSNRSAENKAATVATLTRLGINTSDIGERFFPQTEIASSKTARFETVEKRANVLLYIGDNLRDFSDDFAAPRYTTDAERRAAVESRYATVGKNAHRWGNDWFLLPNPVYGEWTKLFGANPRAALNPTRLRMLPAPPPGPTPSPNR